MRRLLFGLAVACSSLFVAPLAHAYCRTTTCDPPPEYPTSDGKCEPDGWAAECAALSSPRNDYPLFWSNACVGFSIAQGSRHVSYDQALAAAKAAFGSWSVASCQGGRASIDARDLGPVTCTEIGYHDDRPNQHVIVFRDDGWPYRTEEEIATGQKSLTIALTTVNFDKNSGEILDADIEINSGEHNVVPADTPGPDTFDLQAVLTHETGHFLGLSHTPDTSAVMYARDEGSDTKKRTLQADDVAGICSVYHADGKRSVATAVAKSGLLAEAACDATPKHGFSATCAAAPSAKSCSCDAPGAGAPLGLGGSLAAGLALLGGALRRRGRSRGACYRSTMRRRAAKLAVFLSLLGSPVVLGWAAPHDAQASVSIAITWDALLARSNAAAIVIPAESRSLWENDRIYTYTRALVDRPMAGDLHAGDEIWIRTMGGIVGDLGQRVEGEAVFVNGRPSLVFVHPGPIGAYEVTARGQGQFPVVLDANKQPKLVRSGSMGTILAPAGSRPVSEATSPASPPLAADVVHGRAIDDVARDVAAAWSRTHAK